MKSMKQTNQYKKDIAPGKQRSYHEIIEYFDANWSTNTNDTNLSCIKKLDKALGSPSTKIDTILVTGTNGKSLTMNFTSKLLKEEGLSVGSLYAPHILTYNERFSVNNESISNKQLTEIANEVITVAETEKLTPSTLELITLIGLIYFQRKNIDVALLEMTEGTLSNPATICSQKITAITRITPDNTEKVNGLIQETLKIIKPKTWVVSADQSKLNLQTMLDIVKEKEALWAMPIRKLAPLSYPFEQLHGRCASLAERIAHIYINQIINNDTTVVTQSLLTKPKAQRGRPTIEAKKQAKLNPQKTIAQFWKETTNTLPGRFQLLDKEKPTILLDNASNLDAFNNLLLGIRLLHYQRSLKGLTFVLGLNKNDINTESLLKALRYFFKKTSGQVIVCPTQSQLGQASTEQVDLEKITNDLKSMKIKARLAKNFKEAFEVASKTVDDHHGLVVVTGSSEIISNYWNYKGMKKI